MQAQKLAIFFYRFFFYTCFSEMCDLTVVGPVLFADGIGRQSIGLIDCLKDTGLTIQFVNVPIWSPKPNWKTTCNLTDVPLSIRHYFQPARSRPSNMAILEAMLTNRSQQHYRNVPQDSLIKIAYTMLESTAIPEEWVTILNSNFDAAVVPDPFLVDAYKNSGVKIPVFVLPLGLYLDDFLKLPLKKERNKIFVVLDLAAYQERKNQMLLLESFAEVFGDNPMVKLKMNGRFGFDYFKNLTARYEQLKKIYPNLNVELSYKALQQKQYVDEIANADVCVNISIGEGYGVFIREAMAAGRPSIVANNTAQKTICDSGLVCAVRSEIKEPAFYPFCDKCCGNYFNCEKEDVKAALLDMFTNYEKKYLRQSPEARDWAAQWTYPNLQKMYYTLVNPDNVILGQDSIEDGYIITSSTSLEAKYQKIIKSNAQKKLTSSKKA